MWGMYKHLRSITACLLLAFVLQAGMLGFGIVRLLEFNEAARRNHGMHWSLAINGRLVTTSGIRARLCFFERPLPNDKTKLAVIGTLFHSVACDVLATQKADSSMVQEFAEFRPLRAPRWSEGVERNGPHAAAVHQVGETALGWPFRFYFFRGESADNMQVGVATVVPLPEQEVVWWRLAASIGTTIALSFFLLRIPAILRLARGYLRSRKGLCPECGYQIDKGQFKCPECGRPIGAAIVTSRA